MKFKLPITLNSPASFKILPKTAITFLNVNSGYIKDNFARTNISKKDVCFSASPFVSSSAVVSISLKKYFKPTSHQYQLSSCVANAAADTIEAEICRSRNLSPSDVQDMSRLFIYYNARNNTTPPSAHMDKGTFISLAFDSISRYGVPPESIWPYDASKVSTRPSILAYRKAMSNRFARYYSINSSGKERTKDIVKSLNSGHPVVFGTAVDAAFLKISGHAVTGPPSNPIGQHAMVVTSWNSAMNAFEVRNSWGEEWGNGGYSWLTASYMESSMTEDLWILAI